MAMLFKAMLLYYPGLKPSLSPGVPGSLFNKELVLRAQYKARATLI